ncbi:uncharacterized protein A4U43_C02F14790 [Asparagus officinalis]|uniref:Uncharacterized protein n=1 Tax=Asparagus officinalis TaxID=4686 RepID=A0A5P1FK98_ASPOF|nr:uncharacterized protein A4U43_C02F14790 [Asparagus officinalis]
MRGASGELGDGGDRWARWYTRLVSRGLREVLVRRSGWVVRLRGSSWAELRVASMEDRGGGRVRGLRVYGVMFCRDFRRWRGCERRESGRRLSVVCHGVMVEVISGVVGWKRSSVIGGVAVGMEKTEA